MSKRKFELVASKALLALLVLSLSGCGRTLESKKQMTAAQSSRLTAVGSNENPVPTQESFRILSAGCRADYTEFEWETSTKSKQVNFRIDLVRSGYGAGIPYVQVRCAGYQDYCHIFDATTGREVYHATAEFEDLGSSVRWHFYDNRTKGDGESNTDWINATAQGYRPMIIVQSGYTNGMQYTVPQCVMQ